MKRPPPAIECWSISERGSFRSGNMASRNSERIGSERAPRTDHARKRQRIHSVAATAVIFVDEEMPSRALGRVLDLARAGRLTAYNASYLKLAMRLGIRRASKDADLCDASEHLGFSVLRAA
jgi:hypothetical protein